MPSEKSAKRSLFVVTGYPYSMTASASQPWAAAIPSATRFTPSCTLDRVCSLTARIVPSIIAVSGITLFVVPATSRATVSTAGSNGSTERVIIVLSAVTISHATGTGSRARNGSLAWPPRPVTVTRSTSADAITAPGRVDTQPVGSADVM